MIINILNGSNEDQIHVFLGGCVLPSEREQTNGLNDQDSWVAGVKKCRGGRSEAAGSFGKNAVGDDQITGGEVQ